MSCRWHLAHNNNMREIEALKAHITHKKLGITVYIKSLKNVLYTHYSSLDNSNNITLTVST